MSKYTLEQVQPQPIYIESSGRWQWPLPERACFPGCCTSVVTASREWWEYAPSEAKPHPISEAIQLRDGVWYWTIPAALLRERESAKAAVTDETRGTYACPICGKEYPHSHPEDTSRVNWHSDYRKVFEDIISANVRLYKDGVSIAPTNYSHESKLTVAGIAGHWFAYGAEDARSFGRESKGTDSAAWSEFASNGDGYAYAWMDSLWSLFKQTVVALKGREAVAPMLASARVPDELKSAPASPLHPLWGDGYLRGWNACRAVMLAAAPKPEKE